MFRDEARIYVKAGDGGDGCSSFRRERYVPKGGPDGGNGGRGGSIIFVADSSENTLFNLVRAPHVRAENGRQGMGKQQQGRSGEDTIVPVPVGTVIRDAKSNVIIKDLSEAGDRVCVAIGGKGGRGNASFKSALNQTPRKTTDGREGEQRTLRLELKLIADVGLVGLPNAGKSTLISKVSSARPKVADYPFTTLVPHPGIVRLSGYRSLVMMDIPGLVEGAHGGQGLGDRFLRHIERTKVLAQLVDLAPDEGSPSPQEAFHIIEEEMRAFGHGLMDKPRIVVFSRADLVPDADERVAELVAELGVPAFPLSALSGQGVERLLEACWKEVEEIRQAREDEETKSEAQVPLHERPELMPDTPDEEE